MRLNRNFANPRTLISILALAGSAYGTGASGAAATSCVPVEPTVEELVGGSVPAWSDTYLWDRYDFAITGTVLAAETNNTPGSPQYGATAVSFEVINGYAMDSIPAEIVVHAPDPGWMSGYAFDLGATYFVPLVETDPQGETNYSAVCDPIFELTPDRAAALPSFAAEAVAVVTPPTDSTPPTPSPTVPMITTQATPPVSAGSRGSGDDDTNDVSVVGAIGIAVAALTIAGVVALYTRRHGPSVGGTTVTQ